MKLPVNLQKEIVDFLVSLPNIQDTDTQRALLYHAGLDSQLQTQIAVGKAPTQFMLSVVSTLTNYGTIQDGRNALEAFLESTKNFVGQDKQAYCDKLLQKLNTVSDDSLYQPIEELQKNSQKINGRIHSPKKYLQKVLWSVNLITLIIKKHLQTVLWTLSLIMLIIVIAFTIKIRLHKPDIIYLTLTKPNSLLSGFIKKGEGVGLVKFTVTENQKIDLIFMPQNNKSDDAFNPVLSISDSNEHPVFIRDQYGVFADRKAYVPGLPIVISEQQLPNKGTYTLWIEDLNHGEYTLVLLTDRSEVSVKRRQIAGNQLLKPQQLKGIDYWIFSGSSMDFVSIIVQPQDGTCDDSVNLAFDIINDYGLLQTVNDNDTGKPESLKGYSLPSTGSYIIRIYDVLNLKNNNCKYALRFSKGS